MSVRRVTTQHATALAEDRDHCFSNSIQNGSLEESIQYGDTKDEVEMQRALKYFFMNPIEKYQARRRKPFKLAVQVIKVIVVTAQLCLLGKSQFSYTTFLSENTVAFEHIFLSKWETAFDSPAYPSTRDLYAIYLIDEFYEHLDHIVYQFANIEEIAIGTYDFYAKEDKEKNYNISICQKHYEKLMPTLETYTVNLTSNTTCLHFNVTPGQNISMRNFLKEHMEISFDRLIELKVNFSLRSVHINRVSGSSSSLACIKLPVEIHYDYSTHSGRLSVRLTLQNEYYRECTNKIKNDLGVNFDQVSTTMLVFDGSVILLCLLSFILCSRSLLAGQALKRKAMQFFKEKYDHNLSRSDRMEFLNLWYVTIIVSDVGTITGSIFKMLSEVKVWVQMDYSTLLLGCSCFLVWFGVLRYLGFFSKYNILILTLKKAMPNVLRFIVCAGIIYLAYGFLGWIVLGPYHEKFRSFSTSMECMYSLVNGDDMFATFQEMPKERTMVWIFSKIYLYSFISLFIYVVLSLFIAVIMDTYETVKGFGRKGYVEGGELKIFISKCLDRADSGHYRTRANERWKNIRKYVRRFSSFERSQSSDCFVHCEVNNVHASNIPT